jgi:hypothetical protein
MAIYRGRENERDDVQASRERLLDHLGQEWCERWFRMAELLRVQRSLASCSRANKREREGVTVSGRVWWMV